MEMIEGHWITTLVISFTLFFTILYWFYILPQPLAKKMALISAFCASGCLTLILYSPVPKLGPLGGLVILACWLVPSLLVWNFRSHFQNIDWRNLIGLQIFRIIGAFFILEMTRGLIPPIFALPAGIGDILVGVVAACLFFAFHQTPRWAVVLVTFLGLLDFAAAFFFGITSSSGPFQLFAKREVNQLNFFPTGMIPLYLVPYALVNHTLAIINLKNHKP